MDTVFAERPHFFEGQYLGADDLQTLLAYLREQAQRHRLAAHSWGIVTGVEVASHAAADGSLEIFLTPGIAVDGYGRLIAVLAPFKLDAGLFATQPSGLVNVWLRYAEASAGGVRPGFEVCDAVDAFTRVSESFSVEVGLRNNLIQRESGVAVNDTTFTDARDALGQFLPDDAAVPGGPLAPDGSVAAQLFPNDDDPSRWLIPVGRVAWQQGNPGSFGAVDETAQKQSMLFRRQAGIVAESIIAANGLLRLRTRWLERATGKTNDEIAQTIALAEKDLLTCHGRIEPSEPIWLEEATRMKGDLRLFGTRIEWQDAAGTDYNNKGIPFAMRRRPDVNPLKGADLQLLLGKAVNGPNRLVIGGASLHTPQADPCQIEFDFTDGVIVQDDAKVGIGTAAATLAHPLTIHPIGTTGEAIGLQTTDGKNIAWRINYGPNGTGLNFTHGDSTTSDLFIDLTGNVGIGTATPDARLDVRPGPVTQGNPLGSGKWLQIGEGGDAGRVWWQYGSQLAPLFVMSDLDDPPRMQFQQIGNASETAPQFQSWIGHARGLSSDIAIGGGNVGIGTLTPSRALQVDASEIHSGGGGGGFSFANRDTGVFVESPANGERWVWYAAGGTARLWTGGDKLGVTPDGKVGIGTTTPTERLEVRGNLKLGANGDVFAVGSTDNLRLVAGSVPLSGVATGSGWTAAHGAGDGSYRINFTSPFTAPPIVTVTLVEPQNDDNVICVRNVSGAGFDVISRDIDPTESAGTSAQDTGFNFIALGQRP
jgi:hypothetical protein